MQELPGYHVSTTWKSCEYYLEIMGVPGNHESTTRNNESTTQNHVSTTEKLFKNYLEVIGVLPGNNAVLRIRYVYPRSRIRIFSHPGSRIRPLFLRVKGQFFGLEILKFHVN